MKQLFIAFFFFITFSAEFALCQEGSPLQYLRQSLYKIIVSTTVMNAYSNYDFDDGICLYGSFLNSGSSEDLVRTFTRGEDYLIIGAGDDDIVDLDLKILSTYGTVIVEDQKIDAIPIIEYSPPSTQKSTLKLLNFKSNAPGFCSMIILKKNEYATLSFDQIAEALDNVMEWADNYSLFNSGLRFPKGNFCLFGGRESSGHSTYLFDNNFPYGNYTYIGAGSDNISDVDLYVIEQKKSGNPEGVILISDTGGDNIPRCNFTAYSSKYYRLEYKNYRSIYSGFIFTILLNSK